MNINISILYPAIPVILLLVFAEIAFLIKGHLHDKKDIAISFGFALCRLPVAAATNGLVLYFYTLIYHYRIFTLGSGYWYAWSLCFIFDDFSFYWFHRLSHKIRFLWASHQVHHSSEKYTLSSGLRVPLTSDFTGNFLFWAWMPIVGIEPCMVIFMKSVSVLYQFWLHTEIIGKLPKWFEAIFNTPSHHRVHHGSNVEYLDKNHGGNLIIWDKIFGTFQEETFKPKYGLTANINSYNPIEIILHEWQGIWRDLKKTKKFKTRINYLFNSPGWSPDGRQVTTKQLQSELRWVNSRNKNSKTIKSKKYEKNYQ